jgi:hypothetical protein
MRGQLSSFAWMTFSRAMWVEFGERPLPEQVALAIVTIHQDIGFEVYLPEGIKADPIVRNYYRSRTGKEVREQRTRDACKLADVLMESVWFPTRDRIVAARSAAAKSSKK